MKEHCTNSYCKNISYSLVEGTFSIYGGLYNIKCNDNTYIMEERAEIEEGVDKFKNGDKVNYCPICLDWEE